MYENTNILAFMKDNENGKAEVCVVLVCTKQENAITSVVKRKCFQSKVKNKHFHKECKLPITNDGNILATSHHHLNQRILFSLKL